LGLYTHYYTRYKIQLKKKNNNNNMSDDEDMVEDDPFACDDDDQFDEDPFAEDDDEDQFDTENEDVGSKEEYNENISEMFERHCKIRGGVSEAIQGKIDNVKERFDIPGCMALSYLYMRNWDIKVDMDDDIDVYGDLGMDYDQEDAGVPKLDSEKTYSCESCFDDELKASEMTALPCGHFFCKDCWKKSIKVALDEDGTSVLALTCLFNKCNRVVTVDDVLRISDSDSSEISRYCSKIVDSYMDHNRRSHQWCPQPNCNSIVAAPMSSGTPHVQCKECSESFCFKCRDVWIEEDHRPCPCEYINEWQSVRSEKGFNRYVTMARKAGLIKSCPRCKMPVEKISERGCLHMKCQNCKCEYCWECLATPYHTFGTSGFYVCPNVKKRKYDETNSDLKTQLKTGDEHNAIARVERYRIAMEHFDRADASSDAIRKDLKFHIETLRKDLQKQADLNLRSTSFLEDVRQELLRSTIMLKWIAVFTYFEYESDESERQFERNTLRIRQDDLTSNLKHMFTQITFGFPFKSIVKEQNQVDVVLSKSFDKLRNSLRHARRDAATARENLCRQIHEYFPEVQNSRKKDEAHWKRRETEWRRANIWLESNKMTEFGNKTRDIDEERRCLERAEIDRNRKNLFRPDWLAKLLHVENKFRHRPWMVCGQIPSMKVSRSMERVAKESIKKNNVQDHPFWWWSMDNDAFCPFNKGSSDVVEKAYQKWCTDRDELNFDHQMIRFSKMMKQKSNNTMTSAKKKNVDEETTGSRTNATEICRFYNSRDGCKFKSQCRCLHIKIRSEKSKDDDDDEFSDIVVNGSLPISLSDLSVKVKINFENIVMSSAMSVGKRHFKALDLYTSKPVYVERRVSKKPCWNCPCGNWIPREYTTCPITGHPISAAASS